MTNIDIYIHSMIMLLPAFTAITCLMLMLLSRTDNLTITDKQIKFAVTAYFSVVIVAWISLFCYAFFPAVFIWINTLLLFSYMIMPVLLYRITFIITEEGTERRFSRWHYAAPVLFSMALSIWCLTVPYEATLTIVKLRGTVIPEGYETYFRAFTSKAFWYCVSGTFYFGLTVRILYRYYRSMAQSDNMMPQFATWVAFLMLLSGMLLSSSIVIDIPKTAVFESLMIPVLAFIAIAQYLLLIYHIIRRTYRLYVIVPSKQEPEKAPEEEKPERKTMRRNYHGIPLTRKSFEEYFRREKPWLNPHFKITDLVELCDLNRSVVSAFINKTYGVNFNRYLNRLRLRELKRLQALSTNKDKNHALLLKEAGFSDSKHYLRALRAEEKPEEKEGNSV